MRLVGDRCDSGDFRVRVGVLVYWAGAGGVGAGAARAVGLLGASHLFVITSGSHHIMTPSHHDAFTSSCHHIVMSRHHDVMTL